MKYLTSTLIFVLFSLIAQGQSSSIGVKSGLSLTNISSDPYVYETQNNYVVGITFDYNPIKLLSIGCELLYEERGGDYSITFKGPNGNDDEKYLVPNEYNYFSFPIKLSLTLGDKFFGFGSLGVCPAILKNSQVIYPPGYLDHFVDPFSSLPPKISKYDFSGLAEIGCGYKVRDKISINLAIRYQYSYTTVVQYSFDHNFGTTIGMGIKYDL